MKYPKDLTGVKFGRLMVLKRTDKPPHLKKIASYWLCKCECGNERVVARTHLVTNHTESCGCIIKDILTKRNKEILPIHNRTHGMSSTQFYEVWKKMKHRCYNKNNKNYHNYGGRGISVCPEWHKFESFMNDMYESYIKFNDDNGENTATLERKNVDGNYCKDNCTWITIQEQQLNRRNLRR